MSAAVSVGALDRPIITTVFRDHGASAEVAALRRRLASNGYRPLAVSNFNDSRPSPGKRPIGREWERRARQNPPEAATLPATADALNTGLLCDGLRPIDIDIDDAGIAAQVDAIAVETLGAAPTRFRLNSGRVTKLYRAAAGEPRKRFLVGCQSTTQNSMKVEVLGCGNQFVVDGMHASGVPLEWRNGSPETVPSADLTPVTEEQIDAFFAAIAPLIKPTGEKPAGPASDRTSILGLEASDPLRIIAALADIPNVGPANWEDWNYIGMAVWAATGGREAGRTAFHRWSARNPTYDAKETEERWHHWHKSPPTQVGAGTLFHLAAEARKRAAPATTAVTTGLLSIDEVEALPDPVWLVEGLLQEQTLAIAYGPPKHGKTFIVLSMALHIAAGRAWCDREVRQGGVVYIAGEGAGGLKLRVRAARKHFGIPSDIPFWILPRAVNFSDSKAVDALVDMIRAATNGEPIGLVVIDTLARAMPGVDENSAGEVGKVIAACDGVKEQLGCTVMPVHHAGKDGDKGMRGSSALDGAVDTLFRVTRDRSTAETDIVTLANPYQKDGEEAPAIFFDMVKVGATEGRTSLVPVLRDGVMASSAKLPRGAARALDVLRELVTLRGGTVPEADWRRECDNRRLSASDEPKCQAQAFRRALGDLLDRKLVLVSGGMVGLPGLVCASDFSAPDTASRASNGFNEAFEARPIAGGLASKASPPLGVKLEAAVMPNLSGGTSGQLDPELQQLLGY